MKKQKAIIVDLDGTLCDNDKRRDAFMTGQKNWEQFYAHIPEDTVNEWCLEIIKRFAHDHRILFVTGRQHQYRDMTIDWLNKNIWPKLEGEYGCSLLIRPADRNHEHDYIVKEEIYNKSIKDKYDVAFILDDRKQVVDMWRRLGLVCLQCAEGDF